MDSVNVAVSVPELTGDEPRSARRTRLIVPSVAVGLLLAIMWSARLADDDIGVNAASGMLGHDALTSGISNSAAGILFAFTAGVAGTFTACNVAVFGAIGPLVTRRPGARVTSVLRPLSWLAAGMIAVAGTYGAIGAAYGNDIPQLSKAVIGGELPVRVLQSIVVFSVIGLALIYLGLAAVGAAPDPLRRVSRRWPYASHFVMGMLIGAFLIGRPYPLFYKMFQYAAASHNALYGALTFILVVLGNALLMAILFLALSATGFQRWLSARPGRARTFTAAALLIAGAFTFAYWGLRVPAQLGYGWFPVVSW
jgi:hypothetical protein